MISTGIKGLDGIITGLRPGDNVVWQIDDIKDYADLVKPFVRQALNGAADKEYWILTLDKLFRDKVWADSFRKILQSLEESYRYPVEIEFTVNFTKGLLQDNAFKINLLQCRT